MTEPFIGEMAHFGFNFNPRGWAFCNGATLPIQQNTALFSLLGTQYGGNGTTNFALPDLRSRTPIGYASSVDPSWQPPSVQIGQTGGVENVTLLSPQLPSHGHTLGATTANGTTRNPNNGVYANTPELLHAAPGALVPLNPVTCAAAGGNQPHPNLQPYTTINFCIALQGIFPSRN